jgi:iron complex transport system substrate-binding protein
MSMVVRVASVALLATACISASAAAPPQRIVSMNVCTDQLVWRIARRSRIASLSFIAADPRTSAIAHELGQLHLNHGIAEEVLSLNPDLIVTGAFGFRPTVAVLRRLGYAVVELPMAERLTDVVASIAHLGKILQEPARAEALIRHFEQELGRLTYAGDGPRPLFVNYDANGWTTGQTGLLADIVHRAGLSTPGDRLGFESSNRIGVETLLLLAPDLIDLGYAWDDPPALASEQHRHPAVRAVLAHTGKIDIPDSAWLCGGPHSLDALEQLRDAREALVESRQEPGS